MGNTRLDIGSISGSKTPQSAFEEGMFDAACGGLHLNANQHPDGTDEAGQWGEGWLAGRDEGLMSWSTYTKSRKQKSHLR
ncbi:MAG TPA: hypothetical protein DIW64_06420 [Cellvibrio sp.]|nr:hypothetical protein [Cellvibrio sp.]